MPLILTWAEIDEMILGLAHQVEQGGKPDLIVAVQRGGLVPGVMLSHALGTRSLIPLSVSRTADDSIDAPKGPPVVVDNPDLETTTGKDILLVDDIVGTGGTLYAALKLLEMHSPQRVRTLTCVVNRENQSPAQKATFDDLRSYIGREVRCWVIFPWEKQAPS